MIHESVAQSKCHKGQTQSQNEPKAFGIHKIPEVLGTSVPEFYY